MATGTDTIDITQTVSDASDTFVKSAEAFLYAQILLIPGLGPVAASPYVSWLFADALTWIVQQLAGWTVLQGMIGNTIMRKAAQAIDYVEKKSALSSLPPTTSDADYEKAEQAEIASFNNMVLLTN